MKMKLLYTIFRFAPRPLAAAVLASVLAAALAGCASFERSQVDAFVDDQGYMIKVEYGTRSKDHVFMVPSPGNGKLVEYRSKLMVRVTLPDGERFSAYRTLNSMPIGTMYMSDDEEWIFLTKGYWATVQHRDEKGGIEYSGVFEGYIRKGVEVK